MKNKDKQIEEKQIEIGKICNSLVDRVNNETPLGKQTLVRIACHEISSVLESALLSDRERICERLEGEKLISYTSNGQAGQMEEEIKIEVNRTLDHAIKIVRGDGK